MPGRARQAQFQLSIVDLVNFLYYTGDTGW